MSGLLGQQLGNYKLLSLLGKGGMATVYRAQQLNIRREVAIKVIKSDFIDSPDFIQRFQREADTIATLGHPHILKLFDYGQHGETVYLVMELLRGGSLADLIQKGPLPPEKVSQILNQISSALDYAHRHGVIHRDLKPQNVLLDDDGNAHLSDFGIAKLLNESSIMTQSGVAMGTPAYMAPEQWRGQPADARADIYALGIMLYEMLSGQQPFRADTPFGFMHMHVYDPPPALRVSGLDVPPGVQLVVQKALAKDREQRYQTAGELALAFNVAMNGQHSTLPPILIADPPQPLHSPGVSATQDTQRPLDQPAQVRPTGKLTPLVLGIGIAAVLLVLVGGSLMVFSHGFAPATPTLPPTIAETIISSVPPATPTVVPPTLVVQVPTVASSTMSPVPTAAPASLTATPIDNLNPGTSIALTFAAIFTTTAQALPTLTPSNAPNEQQTVSAMLAGSLTAMAVLANPTATTTNTPSPQPPSQTPSPSPTPLPPTVTPTPTFTSTPTVMATYTPIATPSSLPTRTLIPSPTVVPATPIPTATILVTAPITVSNAKQVTQLHVFQGQTAILNSLAFSPDSKLLASGGSDKQVKLWNIATSEQQVLPNGHSGAVNTVAFSPDGKWLASGSADTTVMVWDVKTGTLQATLKGHTGAVTSLAFSSDGTLLAAGGSGDNTILVWTVATGALQTVLTGHKDTVTSLAFNPDGSLLVSGSTDATVRVWDMKTDQAQAILKGPTKAISDVVFSPDGTAVLSGSPGVAHNAVWQWKVKAAKVQPQGQTIAGLSDFTRGLAFNADGTLLAYGDSHNALQLWDVKMGLSLAVLPGHADAISGLVFNHTGSLIATSSVDKTIRLWGLVVTVPSPVQSGITATANPTNGLTLTAAGNQTQGSGLSMTDTLIDTMQPSNAAPTNTTVPPTNTFPPPTNTFPPPTNTKPPPTNTKPPPTSTPFFNKPTPTPYPTKCVLPCP